MKLLRLLPLLLLSAVFFTACQKDLSFEGGQATGTLKDDGTGDCLPVDIKGTYTKDIVLDATNYVDIEVDVSQTGSYLIKSDTLNGYSLSALGNFAVTGTQTIRLLASGKPIAAGVDVFTIEFGGTTCEVNIVVNGAAAPTADFTLGSTAGLCTGVTVNGTYMAGLVTTASNTVVMDVNVITAGTYTLSISSAVNGVTFSGSGTFTSSGAQTITLVASGTPAAAGTFTYPVTAGTSNCSFDVTYAAAAGPAVYTLNCGTPVLSGTYQAGTAMTTANTMTVGVNVTSGGTYSITTAPAINGVTFSGSGLLPATPAAQTVILTATGTPAAAGPFTYTLTGAATTCTVPVTFAAVPPGAFSFNCGTPPVPAGDYRYGVVLDPATNTVTVSINVTTLGAYSITSSAAPADGTTFTAAGTFTALGGQTVVLHGAGTSTVQGTSNHTITSAQGTGTCGFTVYYEYFLTSINGGPVRNFSFDCEAVNSTTILTGYDAIIVGGFASALSTDPEAMAVVIGLPTGGTFNPGTWTVNDMPAKLAAADYTDPTAVDFQAVPMATPQVPGFTIIITTVTATRIIGTYTGQVKDNNGAGPGVKTVAGSFGVNR